MEEDNKVYSGNSAFPDISDRHQTESKNSQYLEQEVHHNQSFTQDISADQNRSKNSNHNKNSKPESTKQQNSRQYFKQYLTLNNTEKQCSHKIVQINERTKIKRHETCVTVKRKRKRTPINRLSGMGEGIFIYSPTASVLLKRTISRIGSNKGIPIIRFLNKIGTWLKT